MEICLNHQAQNWSSLSLVAPLASCFRLKQLASTKSKVGQLRHLQLQRRQLVVVRGARLFHHHLLAVLIFAPSWVGIASIRYFWSLPQPLFIPNHAVLCHVPQTTGSRQHEDSSPGGI